MTAHDSIPSAVRQVQHYAGRQHSVTIYPTMEIIWVAVFVFCGVFTQTTSGFGMALVAMPLLTPLIGLIPAGALIALVGMTTRLSILFHYREAFDFLEIAPLTFASAVGIVMASLLFPNAGEGRVFELLLGVFVVGYAVINLINPGFPHLKRRAWAYPFGLASGVLARVYNIGGPPAVIYANGRRWPPPSFKGNLQAFAMVNGLLVIASRAANGDFTLAVLQLFLVCLPAVGLALLLGFLLDQHIKPKIFRLIVLSLLFIIGLNLIL